MMCSLLVAFSLVFRLVYSSLLARLLCLIYWRTTCHDSNQSSHVYLFPPCESSSSSFFSLYAQTVPFLFPFRHSPPLARFIGINRIELHTRFVFFSWFRPRDEKKERKKQLDVYSMSFLYIFDVDAFHSLLGWDKNLNKNNNKEGGDFGLLLSVVYGQEKNKFAKQWGGSLLYIYIPSLNGIYLRIRWPIVQ